MSYKRTLRGVDYLIENELDFLAKEKHAQIDEKAPSRTSDAFEAIGDGDIPW